MNETKKPSTWQAIGSVLASFIGVQSDKNRERDFEHGSYTKFIVLGVVFTVIFVLTVYGVVRLVLHNAGL